MISVDVFLNAIDLSNAKPVTWNEYVTAYINGNSSIELISFSRKLTFAIPSTNPSIKNHYLVYDPSMNWIVYMDRITHEYDNAITSSYKRTYFKQIDKVQYDYFTGDSLQTIIKIHENLVFDNMIDINGKI